MERSVFLMIGNEEYSLGTVKEVLSSRRSITLFEAVRGAIEEMVFSDDESDYTVCSLEVR